MTATSAPFRSRPRRLRLPSVALVAAAHVAGCGPATRHYDLPPVGEPGTVVVVVRAEGEPDVVLPFNAAQGLLAGGLSGAIYDCALWFCVPIFTTLGTVGGLAGSTAPSAIDDVEHRIDDDVLAGDLPARLVAAVVDEGNRLGGYTFIATDGSAGPETDSRGITRDAVPTPIPLVLEPRRVGVRFTQFMLEVGGRVGDERIRPVASITQGQPDEYWLAGGGENLRAALDSAIHEAALRLVREVFVARPNP